MPEKSSSPLDARELLVSSGKKEFYTKEHEVWGSYEALWGFLDVYLQNLEPLPWYNGNIIPLEKHSPEYQNTRRQLFLGIMRSPKFDIKQIYSLQITENGILHIKNNQGTIQTINIIESWNALLIPHPSTTKIHQNSRQASESLEKEIHTESYLGGNILVSYIPALLVKWVALHSLYYSGKSGVEFVIEKLMIKNTTTGKMEWISLSESYKGTKESIESNLIKILEKLGYIQSPREWGFFSPEERALSETKKTIQQLSYEEYVKERSGTPVTREQFESMRQNILWAINTPGSISPWASWSLRIQNIVKSVGRNAGELLFFPVFFSHFSKYQNTATFLQWASEMVLFTAWARLSTKVPMPPLLRPLGGLALGWAFVLGGKEASTALDMNRKKWEYMFDDGFGSLYTDGKSTTGHLASNLGVFNMIEYMDLINIWGQKLANITGTKSEDLDIGIPRIEMPTPFGKYLGTIPEITLFQSTVNFGTNPWDWMRSALGRDTVDWNKKVFLYNERLKRVVEDIVTKYMRSESMFASKWEREEAWGRENLLKMHLLKILSAWSDGNAFEGEKGKLIEWIVEYAKTLDKKNPNFQSIRNIIENRTSQMIIDDFFIEKRSKALAIQASPEGFSKLISQITSDSKKQRYIATLLERMIASKAIVAPGKWEKIEILGTKSEKWIPSEENILFQNLLEDKKEVEIFFPGFQGKISTWNAFSMYLDMLLEHKRESEFITQIKKWNKKWVKWTL